MRSQLGMSWTNPAEIPQRNRSTPQSANMTPMAAPANESTRLSVRSCSTRRLRVAPRAVRIDISRTRPLARASCRLATLAQAISRTKPVTPSNSQVYWDNKPPIRNSRRGITMVRQPVLVLGNCRSSRCAMASISVRACSTGTPGDNRATLNRIGAGRKRQTGGGKARGIQASMAGGKSKPAGITPTTLTERPSIWTFLPTMPRSAAKRRTQNL